MHPLDAATAQPLVWHQQGGLRRSYDLLNAAGQPEAQLHWQGMLSGVAVGETQAGRWQFKQVGFFNPYLAVRNLATASQGEPALHIQLAFNGQAHFTDAQGRHFVWKPDGLWGENWSWLMNYEAVVRLRALKGRGADAAELFMTGPGLSAAERSLLVLAGWYLLARNTDGSWL